MRAMAVMFVLPVIATAGIMAAGPTLGRPGVQTTPADDPGQTTAAITQYCVGCHNERAKSGDVVLAGLDPAQAGLHPETWEKVLRKLRTGLMPPAGMPRPDAAGYARLMAALESTIDRAAATQPNPGRPAVHRLNRLEYTNSIRDLLALEVDGRSLLPADDAGFGFDNIADVLSVSPGLMERYLAAAETIAGLAVGDRSIGHGVATYPNLVRDQADRLSNALPAGTRGGMAIRHYFPLDGEYVITVRLQTEPQFSVVRGLDFPTTVDVRLDGARLKLFRLDARKSGNPMLRTDAPADAGLTFRVSVKAGMRVMGVTLSRRTWYVESLGPEQLPATSFAFQSGSRTNQALGKQLMGVDHVTIDGPYAGRTPQDTPSRRRLFVCRPEAGQDEAACARTILTTLARRAFRRPATATDAERLMRFFTAGRAAGGFDDGIQRAVEAVLVDPEFLFRVETDPPDVAPSSVYRVSDIDLASRLSFFLWSGPPDDALLDAAAAQRLREPGVLDAQVRRMLADPRSTSLLTSFFGQWLWLKNIATVRPDAKAFPEFDERLRAAFQRETALFIESQVREDHSALDLLTADYTFVNEKLARHYDIPHVFGSHFRRVTLPEDRRAGLLGQGAILTVTSYPNRTSPVVRGKWLLETILGAPPPPPPANVPPFPEQAGAVKPTTVRARMEQHRKNPVCANCHAQLDPLGFALENFNGVGQWRSTEANAPVDASGSLPGGQKFSGPAEFRSALMTYEKAFTTNLVDRLLTYALGRGVETADMPAVRQILAQAEPEDYRWSAIITGIVRSLPFQMKRAQP
jgi:mono/diheme cytochrome c family protein